MKNLILFHGSEGEATSRIRVLMAMPMNHGKKKACRGLWVVISLTVSQPVMSGLAESLVIYIISSSHLHTVNIF